MGRYEVEKKGWTWPGTSNMTDLALLNNVITPLHSVIAYPLHRSPEIMLVSSTLNSMLKQYTILNLYLPMITLLWAYQASLTLVSGRFSKENATAVTTAHAIKQLARPMAERQTGHRNSRSVLSVLFPVVNWGSRSVAKSAYHPLPCYTRSEWLFVGLLSW